MTRVPPQESPLDALSAEDLRVTFDLLGDTAAVIEAITRPLPSSEHRKRVIEAVRSSLIFEQPKVVIECACIGGTTSGSTTPLQGSVTRLSSNGND